MTDYRALVEQFVDSVERFCTLIDEADRHSRPEFVTRLYRVLAELCASSAQLPPWYEFHEMEFETPEVPDFDEERARLSAAGHFDALARHLEPIDYYWGVYDPYETSPDTPAEVLRGWLFDDVTDIYYDLKRVLRGRPYGGDTLGEIFEWTLLQGHWGNHLTDALRALFWIVHHYPERLGITLPAPEPEA